MGEQTEKNLSYYIFKKSYPNWVYFIVFGVYLVGIGIWILLRYLEATR